MRTIPPILLILVLLAGLGMSAASPLWGRAPGAGEWQIGLAVHTGSRGEILPCT